MDNQQSSINHGLASTVYSVGIVLLMSASTAVSNVPALAFSSYFDFLYRKEVCVVLYALGALLGIYTWYRHGKRKEMPWKFPQSSVFLPYCLFVFVTLLAIAITK